MTSRHLLISLNIFLLAQMAAFAQSAEDFFHDGAMNYLSNNIPKALEVVTNGRSAFPDDVKLKKLEELLKQQNQQQQQQQNQENQDKQDQQKQDQQNKNQQKQQNQQQSKQDKKNSGQPQQTKAAPGQMTPEQAKRLLDGQKGDEQALVFRPDNKPKNQNKPVKDW